MIKKIIASVLLGGLPACQSIDIKIVAHRGASYDAPENTLAAFNLAWQQNTDAIEGDFFLTKDSAIVCIHDKTTGRLAGKDLVVSESTLEQLRQLDVGSWKGSTWVGERIPTIDEVLATVPAGKKVFIEIKCGPEIIPFLKRSFSTSGLSDDQIVIISFDQDVIAQAKKKLPQIKAFWLTGFREHEQGGGWQPSLTEIVVILNEINADGLDCSAHEAVDASFAEGLTSADLELHVWTVDDPATARRMGELGVYSITTNRPGWLRDQLR